MSNDCGFDIFPRLAVDADRDAYKKFIAEIIDTYDDIHDLDSHHPDQKLLELPTDAESSDKHNIRFTVGEYPSLPFDPEHCGYFLRFSSKVSGRQTAPAEVYVKEVFKIARKYFGKRARWWNETHDNHGRYSWQVIHDAANTLKKIPVAGHDGKSQPPPPVCRPRNDVTSHCPTFKDLPGEHDLDLEYYTSTNSTSYRPAKNWCFLGQIVGIDGIMRMSFLVRDKAGVKVPVWFYTKDRGFKIPPSLAKAGNTIAILYAEQHAFMDFSTGIRVEAMEHVKIFTKPLDDILRLLKTGGEKTNVCGACKTTANKLLQCGRCNVVQYCNKECQTLGWKSGHKDECKLIRSPEFKVLLKLKQPVGKAKLLSF